MIKVKEELPDCVKLGDGNFCEVRVKTELGLVGTAIYGCSGFMGEGYDFWMPIKTIAGNVTTKDKIIEWEPIDGTSLD